MNSIKKPFSSANYAARQRRIYNFLHEHYIAVLSTVEPSGDPHGTVVYYALDTDFTIHLLTKVGTRKYENIVHHDHVMLTIYDSQTQTVAQVSGFAAERGGSAPISHTAQAIFSRLHEDIDGVPPIMKLQAGAFTTLQIRPAQIRMVRYARPDSGSYQELFEVIESFDLNFTQLVC